jgi:TonB family protein
MKANIPTPCPADWDKMKIGLHSRFCNQCEKNVMDFTRKRRQEILEYLILNKNQNTCARLLKSQLDYSHQDLIVTIQSISKKQANPNLAFYLLTAGAMFLASSTTHKASAQVVPTKVAQSTQKGSNGYVIEQTECIEDTTDLPIEIEMGEVMLGGIRVEEPTNAMDINKVYTIAEKMPEFKGGVDSLMSYLKANINYPKAEEEAGIEGVVYVQFIVGKDGAVREPKILRGINQPMDDEVLRVIRLMPNWLPGEQHEKKVDVYFTIPVRYKLR